MVVQELDQVIALFLLVADDALGTLRVDEEALLAGDGVLAHEGVHGGDAVAPAVALALASTVKDGDVDPKLDLLQGAEIRDEARREFFQGCDARGEQGVATSLG